MLNIPFIANRTWMSVDHGKKDDMVKLNSAESIRGLACLAVVFSHLSLSFFPFLHHFDSSEVSTSVIQSFFYHSPFAFWYSGTAAVFLFFVLSGFVLSYAILRKPEQAKSKIKSMLIKRYPRLAIPALISCLMVWIVFNTLQIDSSQMKVWFQAYVNQDISLKLAVYEGTIGSFLFAESSVNWVLWTMHIELIGSLVLFLLLYIYQFNRTAFFIASLVLPSLALFLKGEGFFLGISSFVIGIYYYLYGKQLSSLTAIVLFFFGLYLAGAHNQSVSYQWIYSFLGERTYEYSNFLAGVFIIYSILMSPQLSKVLDHPILVWLGKISFSVYLLHLIVLYVVGVPIFNCLLSLGLQYATSAIIASIVFIALTLWVSEYYSRWIDQFAVKFSQALANKLLKPSKEI